MFVLTEQRKEIEEDQKLESLDVKLGMRQSGTGLLMVVVVVAVVLMRELTKPRLELPSISEKSRVTVQAVALSCCKDWKNTLFTKMS